MISYGPSRVEIKGDIVHKFFPIEEIDRCQKEIEKMLILQKAGAATGIFSVPEILENNQSNYKLRYVKAKQLNDLGFMMPTKELADRLMKIIEIVSQIKQPTSTLSVWEVMVKKFNATKAYVHNKEYDNLVDQLPKDLHFPNEIGYSHGDFNFDNILYDCKEFYLIDPAWSETESPLWDVGKLMQSILICWPSIKAHGRALGTDRAGWVTPLISTASAGSSKPLIEYFVDMYGIDGVVLSTAATLSRVARWSFADILTPIINKLLIIYLNKEGASQNARFDALCGII